VNDVGQTDRRGFRVEHRDQGDTHALGRIDYRFAHFSALDPFLAHMPRWAAGEVVLIDEATEEIVARRHLLPRCLQSSRRRLT
jgi:hypothetical protein